jgi:hypothetical protein
MITEILELHPRGEPTGRRRHRPHGLVAPTPETAPAFPAFPAVFIAPGPVPGFRSLAGRFPFLMGWGHRTLLGIRTAESRGIHSPHQKPHSPATATAMHSFGRATPSHPGPARCVIPSLCPRISVHFPGKSEWHGF